MFNSDKKEIVTINEPENQITPMDMLQMAVSQGADLEKMEKLMELQERWEKNEAKKAYVVAMSNFTANKPVIHKTKKAHNSKYAGLAETIEDIKEVLADNGLSVSWKTDQEEQLISVTCSVTHILGHSESTTLKEMPDKSGSIKGIQAVASTVSYLERYTMYALLGLASKDMDNDGNDRVSFEQAEELEKLADEAGVDKPKFLVYFQAGSFNHIPSKQYKNALAAIKQKAAKK